jgi:acetyltransferase-like isoleucine patch superfamily enzyme
LILKLINKYNPLFKFDGNVTNLEILSFYSWTFVRLVRGFVRQIVLLRRPKLLLIGRSLQLVASRRISFGSGVKIGDYVTLSGLGKGGLVIGDNVKIDDFSRVEVSQTYGDIGREIVIGNNVGISSFAGIGGSGGLRIGDNCIIGQYFSCHPENHIFSDPNTLIRLQGVTRKGIVIGENCWIGAKVTILDGVSIGSGSVIGAGSVVTRSFPDNSILVGVPARIVNGSRDE